MHKPAVGVIGIGAMGMAIARNLLDRGYAVHVRDIRAEAEAEAQAAGGRVCASPAEVARSCPLVLTAVVDAAQTEAVAFGAEGIAESLPSGGIVIMCSTIAPRASAAIAERLGARGLAMLDAPMSGGPARARDGSMSMMLAGAADTLARTAPLLADVAAKRFVVSGMPGDASKMKLVNNLLAGIHLAAASEAMALALRMGLDAPLVHDVVMASSGASWMFGDRMPRVLAGDYSTKAAVHILAKDLGLALDAAAEHDFPAPVAAVARQAYLATMGLGHAAEDDAAVIKSYARMAGIALPGDTP